MAGAAEQHQTLIHEVRNKKVISQKKEQSAVRIARFLKPCADNFDQAVGIPNTPLLFEIFPHNLQDWPTKVIFKGWNSPQRKWKEWVDSLAEKYGTIWNQTGICDAIMSSIYEVRFIPDLVLGLSEFWCPETNTFMFPWGEATVTLEDMMILGGFPVVGEEITIPLSEELLRIEEEMNKQRTKICRSRAKKASHSMWIKHFMEEQPESEFEHAAFLSLWLSRYVFPSLAEDVIGKHVFPIAAALSQGKPMAIAPAVLGSLYKDLGLLKKNAIDFMESVSVSSPFQLLQLWAFEHFPLVGPTPSLLNPGEPRVARWNNLNLKIDLPLARSALQLAENFKWRPYAADLKNWCHRAFYKETEQLLLYSPDLDGELRSFFQCLKASEVVGVDRSKEKYFPNRVAMQFGMDQDIPADVSGTDLAAENVRFFVPPRSFQPGVSRRYMKWWRDMMLSREGAIKEEVVKKRNEMMSNVSLSVDENGSVATKGMIASVEAKKSKGGCKKKCESDSSDVPSRIGEQICSESSDDDHVPISMRYKYNSEGSPAMKYKTSSSGQVKVPRASVEAKTSKGRCNGLGKLSPASTISDIKKKRESNSPDIPSGIQEQICYDSSDDDHVPISMRYKYNGEGSSSMISKTSSSGPTKKSKVSVGSTTLMSYGKLRSSPVSTKSNIKQNHEAESPEIPSGLKEPIPSDSSDNDHIPIATCIQHRSSVAKSTCGSHQDIACNRYQNAVSPTSSIANGSSRKRELHFTAERISQEEVTKKPTKGVAKEMEAVVGCSLNEPIDIDEEMGEMKNHKKGRKLTKHVGKAGGSLGNPIDIDNYRDIDARGFQNGGRDLQGRVEKLEKLLGVVPD